MYDEPGQYRDQPREGGYREGGGGGGRRGGFGGGRGGGGYGGHGGHGGHGGQGGHGGHGGGRGQRRDPDREGRGIPLSELDPALTEVSRRLIGCAIEVHKGLGPGFDREVYLKALSIEMQAQSLPYAADHEYPVIYRGTKVGGRKAALVIDGKFVVDVYALRGEVGGAERAAMRALLKTADMELGLIINFSERRLKDGLVRVLNTEKLQLPEHGEHAEHGDHDEHGHAGGHDEPQG